MLTGLASVRIKQGYIMLGDNQQLRVRLVKDKAFLAYKTDIDQYSKHEYEYQIPYKDGMELYLSSKYRVEKTRYPTAFQGNSVDIDIYDHGVSVVEIEYESDLKEIPTYCGTEVTGEMEYSNIYIAMNY